MFRVRGLYWAIKELNLDPTLANEVRLFHLHELEEFNFLAYEKAKLYKEKSESRHDAMIKRKKKLYLDKYYSSILDRNCFQVSCNHDGYETVNHVLTR